MTPRHGGAPSVAAGGARDGTRGGSSVPPDGPAAEALRKAREAAGGGPWADAEARAQAADAPADEDPKGAARLLALVGTARAVPFRDDLGDAYLAVPLAGEGCKTVRVRARECRSWLAHLSWRAGKVAASSAALDGALGVLEGQALHDSASPCLPLEVRVADRGGAIWTDLGGPDWRAARVTADGWGVVPAPRLPLHRRYGHMAQQVTPTPGGDLRRLLEYLPLADGMNALLLPWVVAALVPGIPHPALVLHGPAGTGKTTTMRALRRLVDPSATEVLSLPHDRAQLVQTLAHHYCVPFDNVDHLSADMSDALCRAVTGDGNTKRTLYTDDDDTVYRYRRVIMLSGVSCVAQRPDLLDRSLLLALRPIAPADRREEAEYWAAYEADRPAMLGAMLDALSKSMRLRPSVHLREHPRLADYAAWAFAAAEALGIGGKAAMLAYGANVRRQTDEALQAHPVGQALRVLLAGTDGWEGTPAALLDALAQVAERERVDTKARAWPKAPNALRRRIADVQHNLLAEGWVVDLDGTTGRGATQRARWTIRRTPEGRAGSTTPPTPATPYSPKAGRSADPVADPAPTHNTGNTSADPEPLRPNDVADVASVADAALPTAPDREEVVGL